MKNSIKTVLLFGLLFLLPSPVSALGLDAKEVLLLNSISRFLEIKPEGQAMKPLEQTLRSKNPCVKGVGALILYRHYGRQFKRVFQNAFTLNQNIDAFEVSERKFVKLENVKKILTGIEPSLTKLKDDRLRRLFMFFHFRHLDLWLIGKSGEKLSMAVFYRIAALESVFGPGVNVIRLASETDSWKK